MKTKIHQAANKKIKLLEILNDKMKILFMDLRPGGI